MRRIPVNPRPIRSRRGMALLLVTAVIATAAVLSFALLNVASLQAQLTSNLQASAAATSISESGLNVAMDCLQTPADVPSGWAATSGYTLFATGISLNDGTSGTYDLSAVSGGARNVYAITSTGRSMTNSAFAFLTKANVTVTRVGITGSGMFGGNVTVPKGASFSSGGVSGAVAIQANGTVITASGGTVAGTILRSPLSATAWAVPTAATVNFYGVGTSSGTYLCYDGITLGTPQQINASTLNSAAIPARAASNPGAVYYHSGNATISGTFTLPGTLIIRNGTLTISGNATITPLTGFPAMVCEKGVTVSGNSRTATMNGVVFIGGNYAWSGTGTSSKFAVTGALVMPAGSTIGTANNGTLSVTYVSAKANVPDLTTFDQPGTSVKVNSWSE